MRSDLFTDICQPHTGGVYTLAHSTTAARYRVPKQWLDHMVTISSQTADLFITFGDANADIGAAEYAQAVSEELAPNWASGYIVPGGGSITFPCAGEFSHFAVVSSAASGAWSAVRSSGYPAFGEKFPTLSWGGSEPSLWIDFGEYKSLLLSSGIAAITSRSAGRALFAESTNKPALNDALAVGSGLMRAAAAFTAGSSHKLVCSDADVAGMFDGNDSFTLFIPVRRGATGAVHTLFSVGTNGSANGYWNIALDASDDIIVTRVTAAGASSTSVYATTVNTTPILIALVFDGTTTTMHVNRASVSLTGNAAGDIGTASKVAIGARIINTSTYANFATAEIPEVIAFNRALGTADLATMHAWLMRRYGL